MDRNEVRLHCLERWDADDERIAYFEDNYDEWLDQIPDDMHEIIFQLLEFFEYYSHEKVNQLLVNLGHELIKYNEIDPQLTIYTPLAKSNGLWSSSQDYLREYTLLHGIHNAKIAANLEQYFDKKNHKPIHNIVIVDDFCGSGKTFTNFLMNYYDLLKDKTVYYLVSYCMDEAKTTIESTAIDYKLKVKIICINHGIKVFDRDEFFNRKDEIRKQIKSQSKKFKINKNDYLGKYESEALVSFYNNTPNNTIGLFWCDTKNYFSIFPRDFENKEGLKRPTPKNLKKDKADRNAQNYLSSARRAKNEY